ncbi:MAG: hypothetical protein DHS20C20_30080 [Ardenticatenaceae bacterium]|nr:MAG: hypothetical protein DHS20C20_30080 [Ardenticatenaceae bacterium]
MSTILLDPAEFSYLLQTMHANSVIGVDNATLFPTIEAENDALLKRGRNLLEKNGWLKPASEANKLTLDPSLSYLVAIIADPETVILTLRQEQEATQQLMTHYVANQLIVEQARTAAGDYQLGFVSDSATAASRILSSLELTNSPAGWDKEKIFLADDVFKKVKNLAAAGELETAVGKLEKEGVAPPLALAFATSLQQPTTQGVVITLQRENEQFVMKQNLIAIQSQSAGWLIQKGHETGGQLGLEPLLPQLFVERLIRCFEGPITEGN